MEHITTIKGLELEEDTRQNKKKNTMPLSQCILYLHLLLLYILIFLMYNELENTKKTLQQFQLNIIQSDLKKQEGKNGFIKPIEPSVQRLKRDINLPENETIISLTDYDNDEEKIKTHSKRAAAIKRRKGKNQNNRRGKNKKKHKKRQNRAYPRAAHFIGMNPEPIIKDEGIVAPWALHPDAIGQDFLLITNMTSVGHGAIKIMESGLYLIYAQVYYVTENTKSRNSYKIILETPAGKRTISQCATLIGGQSLGGEQSCFTGLAYSLRSGDTVYIQQRERDRHIIMTPENTYFGLVLLRNP